MSSRQGDTCLLTYLSPDVGTEQSASEKQAALIHVSFNVRSLRHLRRTTPYIVKIFTQTKKRCENAKRIYNACTNLTITAREKTSYAFLKQHFRDVQLFPDMVLSLGNLSFECKRSGLLMMLRQDGEEGLSCSPTAGGAADSGRAGMRIGDLLGGAVECL